MSRYRTSFAVLVATAVIAPAVVASVAVAQNPAVQVHGVAYDSVRRSTLSGAIISIAGDSRTTRTDSRGRFTFDSVPPGEHVFSAQHALLDSLGFTGISARATVTDGRDEIRIAGPSFSTLWQSVCDTKRVPRDKGFVYGTVRDAITQGPAPNASVELSWIDVKVDRSRHLSRTRYRAETHADSAGNYYICDVPRETMTRIRAATDSAASGLIDLGGGNLPIQRRDLTIGVVGDSAAVQVGAISGAVSDTSGRPVPSARILADGVREIRAGEDGRFLVTGVPIGTRQVEVLAIGMSPVIAVVDVSAGDTAAVAARMRKITTLDVIRVTASPATHRLVTAIEERRTQGFGYLRDSSQIGNRGTLAAVLFDVPSVQVSQGTGGAFSVTMPGTGAMRCLANVVIDGVRSQMDDLKFLRPTDIAVIEVYPRRMSLPVQFVRNDDCGAIIVWTKWGIGS